MLTEIDKNKISEHMMRVLINYRRNGKRAFLSGGALGFDTLAARAVLELKKTDPAVRLILALPCRSQSSRWTRNDQNIYQFILDSADHIIYVSEDYFPGCMQKRNRYMVDHADTCLCYLTRCHGGTWNTVSYAYDCQRTILNLAME